MMKDNKITNSNYDKLSRLEKIINNAIIRE